LPIIPLNGNHRQAALAGEDESMKFIPFWQRLIATVLVMLVAGYLAGVIWQWIFSFDLPSYVAGAVGGLAALPTWDLLKRIRPSGV
jgi:hypothetical protein